eukprot:scaffold294828_cov23-Tisochrysis_lutea.AAC.2
MASQIWTLARHSRPGEPVGQALPTCPPVDFGNDAPAKAAVWTGVAPVESSACGSARASSRALTSSLLA